MSTASVTFCTSDDLDLPLRVKVVSLEGKKTLIKQSQKFTQASLSQRLSNVSPNSDMFVSLQVFDSESFRYLTIPIYTPYARFRYSRKWNVWLTLPISIKQLTPSSVLKITLWEFDGRKQVEFFSLETPLFDVSSCSLKRGRESLIFQCDDPESGEVKNDEFQILMNKYNQGEIKAVNWLDPLSFRVMERMKKERKLPNGLFVLHIEFPLFEFPIVYSEIEKLESNIPNYHNFEINNEMSGVRRNLQPRIHLGLEEGSTLKFYDPDQFNVDPIEEKFRRLERASKNPSYDKELKPDAKRRDMLLRIINYPPGTQLSSHEKGLIWKYRYYLMGNKKALTKLLQSTNLNEENERKEVLDMMDSWAEIDIEHAIELLGSAFKNLSVRSYAVSRLKKASDYELELYLLQLVQSVCFESSSTLSDRSGSEFTIVDLNQSSTVGMAMPQSLISGQNSIAPPEPLTTSQSSILISPLAEFLIRRALVNARLGNYLFWYLKSESEENPYLIHILESFESRLSNGRRARLEEQKRFVALLVYLCQEIKGLKDPIPRKLERLKHLIQTELRPFLKANSVILPLDPDVTVIDVVIGECKIFKSSLSPLKITFKTTSGIDYPLMFKVGDDLRQDQLVVQIITLMNELLKNENVDLKLTPYKIIATGSNEGAIEFIPNDTMANILSKYHGILPYLRHHHPSATEELGVKDWVMDNFVKSCAGYCVITYILGVGDRHLDNLLITPDGHFFHADFGYILGQDPKPFPPLMKLPPQIIESFGGAESDNYNKFRSYCFVAYSILRRNAGLILNLFELMKTSNIPNIRMDPEGALLKVKEKFCLDISEEEAIVHFQNLINASVSALLPLVIDRLHNLAQYWRA
ncbi:LAMI_0H18778g1_1 [Lachancea mirantina]|uniref:Phosphatidylinositol 3-kinase VPS34 n=1 Tax=Lachancea mirantina TaxID=1230905 RepID=A0A1G4KJY8_9SACH|nr:LAMI_0H18778g1_1 [Lachancea mirantina]